MDHIVANLVPRGSNEGFIVYSEGGMDESVRILDKEDVQVLYHDITATVIMIGEFAGTIGLSSSALQRWRFWPRIPEPAWPWKRRSAFWVSW